MPQLTIIAGPNGSGKSTYYETKIKPKWPQLNYINPDEIAAKVNNNNVLAGRKAIALRNNYIKTGQSFVMETTYSGNLKSINNLLDKAKSHGFKINMVFICTKAVNENIRRVQARVIKGGHDIPRVDIVRRYDRSIRNLKNTFKHFDRTYLIDNSFRLKTQALYHKNKLIRKINPQTEWVKNLKLPKPQQKMKLKL